MSTWTLIFALYALVTGIAIYMTYQEQKRQARPSLAYNLIGYMCCSVWPLVGAAFCVAIWWRPHMLHTADAP